MTDAEHIQTAVRDRAQIERDTRDLLAAIVPKLADAQVAMFRWQRDLRGLSTEPAIDEADAWMTMLFEGTRDELITAFQTRLGQQPEYQR